MLYCVVMKKKTENLYGTIRPNEETVERYLIQQLQFVIKPHKISQKHDQESPNFILKVKIHYCMFVQF